MSRRLAVAQRHVYRPQTGNNTDIDSRVAFSQLLILRGDLRELLFVDFRPLVRGMRLNRRSSLSSIM
jgi:hypothetical protein